jgi:hypothetical protein
MSAYNKDTYAKIIKKKLAEKDKQKEAFIPASTVRKVLSTKYSTLKHALD